MKKSIFILLLLVSGFSLTNCSKTVDPIWMQYEEENCVPPWVGKTDNRSQDNLEALLRADGLIPLKIKIKGTRENNCIDCDCKTGKVYQVQIDRSQMNYLIYYGFSVKK